MKKIAGLLALSTLFLITSCDKDDTPSPEKPATLYVAVDISQRAAYTKNDTVVYLTTGVNSGTARSLFVKGNDVYVAGMIPGATPGSNWKAVYWKNGVMTEIADGVTNIFQAFDIAVTDANEVVICGNLFTTQNQAAVWRNGSFTALTPAGSRSQAKRLAVAGNDVYVAGFTDDASFFSQATCWKNGTILFQAPAAEESGATDLLINGSDVYLTGWFYNATTRKGRAGYWKNGNWVQLSDPAKDEYAEGGLALSGNDLYVLTNEYFRVGTSNRTITRYYKNATAADLTNGSTNMTVENLALFNNQVIAGGYEFTGSGTEPILWKNGVPVTFPASSGSRVSRIRVF